MSLLNFPKELKSTANTHNFYFVPSSGKPDFLLLLCVLFLPKLIGVFLIVIIEEKEKSQEHWVRFLRHNLVQVNVK